MLFKYITTIISYDNQNMPNKDKEILEGRLGGILFGHYDKHDDGKPLYSSMRETECNLLMSFLELYGVEIHIESLAVYFRRYCFRDLGVSKAEHLQNMYEFYFHNVYLYKQRLKVTLNNLQGVCGTKLPAASQLIRAFDRVMESIIKRRNIVVHHHRYSSLNLDKLKMLELMSTQNQVFSHMQQPTYRKLQKEALSMCNENVRVIRKATDITALIIRNHAKFLLRYDTE